MKLCSVRTRARTPPPRAQHTPRFCAQDSAVTVPLQCRHSAVTVPVPRFRAQHRPPPARRLLAVACNAPHSQVIAILCVVSRLTVACPRIATMFQQAEAGGVTISTVSVDVDIQVGRGAVAGGEG